MAGSLLFRRTAIVVLSGAVVAPQIPIRRAYAEAPSKDETPAKKPIYGTHTLPPSSYVSPTSPVSKPNPQNPTPTDRLEKQISRARLFLYEQSLTAEGAFNDLLTWAFQKETNIANTIASLAPAPQTGEQLLPGAIYVLVATMAGSIVARNRNILIRATFPVAVGITAGWLLIPVTMRNTGDLVWEYEKKVPAVADSHLKIRAVALDAWQQAKINTQRLRDKFDEAAKDSRARLESLVEKGK